jgi:hypothetical protein
VKWLEAQDGSTVEKVVLSEATKAKIEFNRTLRAIGLRPPKLRMVAAAMRSSTTENTAD